MLTAAELLKCWEKGIDRPMFERALILLESESGESQETLAELPIGQRDLKLLDLRDGLFGHAVPCIISCPACNEGLELNLDSDALRVTDGLQYEPVMQALSVDGLRLEYRLLNSIDLALVSSAQNSDMARNLLLERCLLTAYEGEQKLGFSALPATILDALSSAMAEADPQSHLELALTCPACEKNWSTEFDITAYFWSEIQNWAIRTLREVYLLASAFGWREADILALSPLRRQLYLESVGV